MAPPHAGGRLREPGGDAVPLRARARSAAAAAAAAVSPLSPWRGHRVVFLLGVTSVPPRVLAALAFRPAELIPDSFDYMQEGVHLHPDQLRPAGYPMMWSASNLA